MAIKRKSKNMKLISLDKKVPVKNSQGNGEQNKADNDNTEQKLKTIIKEDIAKKDEEVSSKLTNALQGLSGKTEKERENSLVDIEKSKNEGKISEVQKDKITEKKNELAKNDPRGYGKMMAKVINEKIKEFKVEIDKLGQATKEKLVKLQNGEFTSDIEVRQVEEKVSEKVSEEVANVELNGLLTEAQKILNGVVNNLQSQLKKIKKDLYGIKFSTNPYQQKAYQQQESKVEKLLKNLESYSQTQPPKSNFFRPEMVIPVSLAVILVTVVAIVVVKRKKRMKVK
ncbi:492_t:CDS:2 [Ambispora gerdemannii]|uniref:492_t:CDS:1 n=1 Tax=Ambispora gerdemannii TaxID=144530 RepID=A0A9N9CJQ2_9GLOM|nr:492_t:CDS:2 [Ambispora gerdemannii]